MPDERDPIQQVDRGDRDLYEVTSWENRGVLDHFATWLWGHGSSIVRAVTVVVAVLIVGLQLALVIGPLLFDQPLVAGYILLSVVPAFGIAAYVWKIDVTMKEPLAKLVVTFVLGVVLPGFAAYVNSALQPVFGAIPVVGMLLFFFLVVGPVEETVKWLAVRLYAYRSRDFDAVIDGAVYGAVAGLGFATIENALYISQHVLSAAQTAGSEGVFSAAFEIAAVRTLAGPGHVIYSSFAGYYLGLAKFNPGDRGPIVVKGLTIAVFIHATYNSVVTYLPAIVSLNPVLASLGPGLVFILFILLYDGLFLYVLYRKIARYRDAFRELDAHEAYEGEVTLDEAEEDLESAVERVEDGEGQAQ